jgi:hypothetical protein
LGDKADATNFTFRVHLFSVLAITCANGDNGAFSVNKAANYLGQVDIATGQLFTDGAMGTATCDIISAAGTVYALIEARAAYTPASGEVFILMLKNCRRSRLMSTRRCRAAPTSTRLQMGRSPLRRPRTMM